MASDPALRGLALRHAAAPPFPGPSAPDWALRPGRRGARPGFTLFGTNVARPGAGGRRCTAALRAARPDVLIAIDEEGGDVTRLAHATGSPYPGNAALGAVDDTDAHPPRSTRPSAPNWPPSASPSTWPRPSTSTPPTTTRSSAPAASAPTRPGSPRTPPPRSTGLQAAGVAACAKHFPGHGATDRRLPPRAAHRRRRRGAAAAPRDLPPFAAAIAAGVAGDHDRAHPGTGADRRPAGHLQPRPSLIDLLRKESASPARSITDALEMQGAAVAPSASPRPPSGPGRRQRPALHRRRGRRRAGRAGRGRRSSPRRRRPAHRGPAGGGRRPDRRARRLDPGRRATGPSGPPPPDLAGYAAARRAVRVEGDLTGAGPAARGAAGRRRHRSPRAGCRGARPAPGRRRAGRGWSPPRPIRPRLRAARPAGRPIVVVGRHLHRLPGGPRLVEALAATHPVAVVEMGWPAAWRPAGVRAFVTTYGASHANGRAAAEALGLTG